MNRKIVHEKYHTGIRLQKRVVGLDNFTYRTTLNLINKYLKKKKRIIDIGSGVGTIDFYLAKELHSVTGLDISSKAVNLAQENAKLLGFNKNIKLNKIICKLK